MRTEGDCPDSRPSLRGPEAVLSLICGLGDSWVEGRADPTAKVSGPPLSGRTLWSSSWGRLGEQRGRKTGTGGRVGLAQVLLVALDRLLDAEQHGGQPLVQPRDGVILLHLQHTRNGDKGVRWLVPCLDLAPPCP